MRYRAAVLEVHLVGQQAQNHVHHDPHQGAKTQLVIGLGDDVQAHRAVMVHQVPDCKFGLSDVARHDGVAVQGQIGLGRRQHRSGLFIGSIHHVASSRADDRMSLAPRGALKVLECGHFHPELGNVALRIGQHGIDAGQAGDAALGFCLVQRMQDDPDQQRLAGFLPVVLQTLSVRIDQQGRQVLHVADFVFAAQPDFIERVPADTAAGCGRLETQHLAFGMLLPPARRQRPQLALQVRDDRAVPP